MKFGKKSKTDKSSNNELNPIEMPEGNVSLRELFRYSTALDYLLLAIGSLVAIGTGAGFPFMAVLFGGISQSFVKAQASVSAANGSFFHTNNNTIMGNVTLYTYDEFTRDIVTYCWYYAYLGTAIFVCSYVQIACFLTVCERQIYRIRMKFFNAILKQDIEWFDTNLSGTLTTKLSDHLERIKEGLGDKLALLIQDIAQFICGFVIAFTYSWRLTLVMMALTPLIAMTLGFLIKFGGDFTKRESELYAASGAIAEEVLGSIRTVVSFHGQKQEAKRYENSLQIAQKEGIRKSIYVGLCMTALFFIIFSLFALCFYYGAVLIVHGIIIPGTVFTVLFSVMMGTMALGNAGPQVSVLSAAMGAAKPIYDIIDTVPKISQSGGDKLVNVVGDIELENVNFTYPSRPDTPVLKNLSLRVTAGSVLALVGHSGCGKSSIVSLLLRYYDTNEGKVTIDGHNVAGLDVKSLRESIGVVSQEPVLFEMSIAENIAMGKTNVGMDEIIVAAKAANAHKFICELPDGYNTSVGERGIQLSGGQKQRVAIARALVGNPRILLLDEATSALDAQSESIVQDALDRAQKGRTTIVIAHRLSTIQHADQIVAIDGGRVMEKGTHAELIAQGGVYAKLVASQTLVVMPTNEKVMVGKEEKRRYSTSSNYRRRTLSIKSIGSTKLEDFDDVSLEGQKPKNLFKKKETEMELLKKEFENEGAQKSTFREVVRYASREKWYLLAGILSAAIRSAAMPAFAWIFSQMFSVYSKTGSDLLDGAIFYAGMLMMVATINGLTWIVSTYMFAVVGNKMTERMRMDCFRNVLRQDIAYFDDARHSSGKICTRLATDAPNVRASIDFRLADVISAFLSLFAGIGLAFYYGWQLTLLVLGVFPLLVVGAAFRMKMRNSSVERDARHMEEAGKTAADAITNVRTVQALTREDQFYDKFVTHLRAPYKEGFKAAHIQGVTFGFAQGVIFYIYAICFRFGAYLIGQQVMEPFSVFEVFFAISFSAGSVGLAAAYFGDYAKAMFSAGLVVKMSSELPTIDSLSEDGKKPEIHGEIEFSNVSFAYPQRNNVTVLDRLSITVKRGNVLALVGASGCGKTTTTTILQRFYNASSGRVLVDGCNVTNMNVGHLRQSIAVVAQEPTLFDCSIADNIVYGMDPQPPMNEIMSAAKQANIHKFIVGLPEGYATSVGGRGTQLSGGQKQRVAIARALIRNPKILLLDEATSALDTESEKMVQEALDNASHGRTCIIIAHRLSTVMNADQIAVIDKGKIIEQGTHTELVAKQGSYYRLVKKQNLAS